MPNGIRLDGAVDPDDPKSIIAWTAQASAAFDEIKRTTEKIEDKFEDLTRWRTTTDIRMATGSERFEQFNTRLKEYENTMKQLPQIIETSVIKAVKAAEWKNPNGRVSFKWLLEKVALPLIMSGAGAGIAIIASRGLFGG